MRNPTKLVDDVQRARLKGGTAESSEGGQRVVCNVLVAATTIVGTTSYSSITENQSWEVAFGYKVS